MTQRIKAGSFLPGCSWVKTAWLYTFIICLMVFIELFSLALNLKGDGSWLGCGFMQLLILSYGIMSYSIWMNKSKGLPSKKP